jgi:hypothetical protein
MSARILLNRLDRERLECRTFLTARRAVRARIKERPRADDVDNTLLDNDRVQDHLREHLAQACGAAARDRYWQIFEELKNELGYADYLGALKRYRLEIMHRPEVLRMRIRQ